MATNLLNVTADQSGTRFPLRGDMAVRMDFTPDEHFRVVFVTRDAGTFQITSTLHPFRALNASTQSALTIGGKIGLSVSLMYDKDRQEWAIVENNLVSGDATTGGTGGTGSGTGYGPEVQLMPNPDGSFTPDKTVSGTNAYRILLTANAKLNDPVGYSPGEEISIAIRQAATGPFVLEYGLAYAMPNRAIPALSTQPYGLNKLKAIYTASLGTDYPACWETDVTPPSSSIGYGVPSFIAKNVTKNVSYYVLRSGTVSPDNCGMTAMRAGETLKILRNGLGIESYGALDGSSNGAGTYLISGAMSNGQRAELRTGAGVRTAYDRGVLVFGGAGMTVTVQDLIISGAREQGVSPGSACGINMSSGATDLYLKNVKLYDNENGMLTGNFGNSNPADDFTGNVTLTDCEFTGNGVGLNGFTHEIYMGHANGNFKALRTTFSNDAGAHNIKSRMAYTELKQVLTKGAAHGRELNLPNGGKVLVENSHFWKVGGSTQGQLIGIGEEGVDTTRPREYIFRNVRFQNDYGSGGQDATFLVNFDHVPMTFIDCEFVGDYAKSVQFDPNNDASFAGMVTVNGIRYWPDSPPVFQTTAGVTPGPILTPGYQPIAVTPIPA